MIAPAGSPRRPRRAGSDPRSVAVPGHEAHALGIAVRHDTEAVVLDLVNPAWARWRLLCRPGQTRIEAPDKALKLTQR